LFKLNNDVIEKIIINDNRIFLKVDGQFEKIISQMKSLKNLSLSNTEVNTKEIRRNVVITEGVINFPNVSFVNTENLANDYNGYFVENSITKTIRNEKYLKKNKNHQDLLLENGNLRNKIEDLTKKAGSEIEMPFNSISNDFINEKDIFFA
jgi:hypothetical protein